MVGMEVMLVDRWRKEVLIKAGISIQCLCLNNPWPYLHCLRIRRRRTPRREKETPYKLNTAVAGASNEFIAEDDSPQQLAEIPAPG